MYKSFIMVPAEQIKSLAAKYSQDTAAILSSLVKHKSVSLHEGQVQHELIRQMQKAGFDEVRMDGLGNVIGRIGSGKRIIAFDAHMDTVDIGNLDNWDFDPLEGNISDGFVHGRGTADQKGGAAAFITAGRMLKELGYNRDVTLYFTGTVIEEDCDGLCWKYLVEEEGIRPDVVVITEPTNLNIYRGQRGRMEMKVHFRGLSCHGSAPERGENAIYMASRIALEIEKLNLKLPDDPFLGKGSITVTEIKSSSPSLCAVSDYASLHLDRRLTRGETKDSALNEIETIINGMDARVEVLNFLETSFTGLEYGMEKYYPSWVIPSDHDLITKSAEVYETMFGKAPLVDKWTFSTNGVTINGFYGIPIIGFGPGEEKFAHAPNEKVPIDHLEAASAFYAALAYTL